MISVTPHQIQKPTKTQGLPKKAGITLCAPGGPLRLMVKISSSSVSLQNIPQIGHLIQRYRKLLRCVIQSLKIRTLTANLAAFYPSSVPAHPELAKSNPPASGAIFTLYELLKAQGRLIISHLLHFNAFEGGLSLVKKETLDAKPAYNSPTLEVSQPYEPKRRVAPGIAVAASHDKIPEKSAPAPQGTEHDSGLLGKTSPAHAPRALFPLGARMSLRRATVLAHQSQIQEAL